MQNILISILTSGAALALVGWVFQLGSRVTVLETQQPDLKELINAQFADVARRLTRIEGAMNGQLKGHE